MEKKKFTHNVGAFTAATLLSRILGYVRDALVAAYFGGGMVTDAFYAALRVPNLLRRFLGEGSMTAAFIPVFTDVKNKKGQAEANRFFNSLFSGLLLIILVVTILGILFAPLVTHVVALGFIRFPEKLRLTSELIRLIFPFLVVISMAALLTAVLNSCGRFFIPAVAPAGLSVGMIVFILLVASKMTSPVHGLAVSVVAGGAIHFLVQIPSLLREGYTLSFAKPFAHRQVITFFLLLGPTIVGLCSDQINLFVDQFCASFLRDGSITALYNSNRIMQLPLALFGIAVASVALPALSKSASDNNVKEFKDLLNFSLRIANYVLIPSVVGLVVLGYPIVQLLFEHGRFTSEFTALTYTALVPYALGLPAYSATKIMASGFYAQKNTKTPVRVALWAMSLHVVANFALMWKFKVAGLAFSTALSAWFQAICLFLLLRKKYGMFGGKEILKSFLFGCSAGLLMGVICWGSIHLFFAGKSVLILVPSVIAIGAVFYFGISKILKIKEFKFLIDTIRKRKIH